MGRGGLYTGDICTFSAIMKIIQFIFVFVLILIHRRGGEDSTYVFFGTVAISLGKGDDGLDLENLGNGALMTWAIITPILFAAYLIDGIDYIQNLFLESLWNFIAACCFFGLGVRTVYVWSVGKSEDQFVGNLDYANNYGAGLAMGSLSLIIAILYSVDFFASCRARGRIRRAEEYNY
jgi:hypothetical protein